MLYKNKSTLKLRTEGIEWEQWTWSYDLLALKPINLNKKKAMMKLWNYGCNSKLISKHMIMINELMIMITIIFMVKVMIIKNKYMNNKNKNTTTNKGGNKNDNKAHHKHFLIITIMIIVTIIINDSNL